MNFWRAFAVVAFLLTAWLCRYQPIGPANNFLLDRWTGQVKPAYIEQQ